MNQSWGEVKTYQETVLGGVSDRDSQDVLISRLSYCKLGAREAFWCTLRDVMISKVQMNKASSKTGQAASADQTPGRPPRLRLATFGDYSGIRKLEERFGLQTKTEDEWRSLWLSNPAYAESKWPIGWVLELEESKDIVGTLSNIPLTYFLNSRVISVATTRAWIIEESYRGFALLLLSKFFAQKNVDLYLCTSVSAAATPSVIALEAKRVPTGAWDNSCFWIVKYVEFASAALEIRNVRFPALLRYPSAFALWTKSSWSRILRRGYGAALRGRDLREGERIERADRFDQRFDEFWKALAEQHPHRLLAVRNRATLEWHFGQGLERGEVSVLVVMKGGRIEAFATFCRKDEPDYGLKRLRLVDFQSLDGDPTRVLPLLNQAREDCRRQRIHVLESIGWQLEPGDLMERIAPFQRTLDCWRYCYRTDDPTLAAILERRDAWDPALYDGDSSFDWRVAP